MSDPAPDWRNTTPPPGQSRLQARHLQKAYGSRKVVKDVSLDVGSDELHAWLAGWFGVCAEAPM